MSCWYMVVDPGLLGEERLATTSLGFRFLFPVMFLEWYFLHRWHELARAPEVE